jgi:hypothetical protein
MRKKGKAQKYFFFVFGYFLDFLFCFSHTVIHGLKFEILKLDDFLMFAFYRGSEKRKFDMDIAILSLD